eukprot:scaffold11197_cov33-Tisochrysis_lutea.AAC.2
MPHESVEGSCIRKIVSRRHMELDKKKLNTCKQLWLPRCNVSKGTPFTPLAINFEHINCASQPSSQSQIENLVERAHALVAGKPAIPATDACVGSCGEPKEVEAHPWPSIGVLPMGAVELVSRVESMDFTPCLSDCILELPAVSDPD